MEIKNSSNIQSSSNLPQVTEDPYNTSRSRQHLNPGIFHPAPLPTNSSAPRAMTLEELQVECAEIMQRGIEYSFCLTSKPQVLKCFQCKKESMSRVTANVSDDQKMCCLFFALAGCWLCCFFPFYIKKCYEYKHYCQSCGAIIGSARPSGWI